MIKFKRTQTMIAYHKYKMELAQEHLEFHKKKVVELEKKK